ncbi:lactate utilization protein [Iocasia frigidifontis]|uniref:Lactate utilization protein n=1 Tax=Iocasia fonsfrigidae TaxID=2682810 RepID=A0A8A7K8Q6_9FIRM|nr:lactate utilization protein [Iocasia fonsfrigidae]QTL97590.1 lactate utilization protein [Iocasia fonsfrigidae]
MLKSKKEYYRIKGNELIKNFKKRNIEGYYCSTGEEAVKKALELIKEGSTVSWGGSMTLEQIGLLEKLKESNLKLLDRSTAENADERAEIYYKTFNCDYFLMSSNAITQDGKLVNIDGNGNRIAALIYGPKNVIVIAGMNKVTKDEESAMKRIRNCASPINAIRLEQNTPCTQTGHCHECLTEDCICCQMLVTRKSRHDGRIKVILVGEELGF